jgi:uncharacterized membrane protein YeiH
VLAASIFVVASSLGIDARPAAIAAFAAGFAMRAGAIAFGWTLPGFTKRS